MMLRSKNAARAPSRCGVCCRSPCSKKSAELDPAAIAQVREEAWPDVRDADELHDVLHTLVALPEDYPGPVHPGTGRAGCSYD